MFGLLSTGSLIGLSDDIRLKGGSREDLSDSEPELKQLHNRYVFTPPELYYPDSTGAHIYTRPDPCGKCTQIQDP